MKMLIVKWFPAEQTFAFLSFSFFFFHKKLMKEKAVTRKEVFYASTEREKLKLLSDVRNRLLLLLLLKDTGAYTLQFSSNKFRQ
jgi:hypothetical protein